MDIPIDDKRTQAAISRLERLAGIGSDRAKELVLGAIRSAAEQVMETAAGTGAVPSNLTDIQAQQVSLLSEKLKRVPSEREIGVLFRITPTRARAIIERMRAMYADPLYEAFLGVVGEDAVVVKSGTAEKGLTWTIRFLDRAAFETAAAIVQTKWGKNPLVSSNSASRSIVVPREIAGEKTLLVLKIAEPAD